jgi:hypothetical protein
MSRTARRVSIANIDHRGEDEGRSSQVLVRHSCSDLISSSASMPSDQSTWLIAVPNDGDSEGVLPEISQKLTHQSKSFPRENIAQLNIPSFKVRPSEYGALPCLTRYRQEL